MASVMSNSVVYLSSCTISLGSVTGKTNAGRDHLSTDIGLGTLERNLPKGKIRRPPPAHLFLVAPKVTQPLVPRVGQADLAEHSEDEVAADEDGPHTFPRPRTRPQMYSPVWHCDEYGWRYNRK